MLLRTQFQYGARVFLFSAGVVFFAGCATKETIPRISIEPNSSGLEVTEVRSHAPYNSFGGGRVKGQQVPPDTPSGAGTTVIPTHPLFIKEKGRYFIPASGRLRVVSLENPRPYGYEKKIREWRELFGKGMRDGLDVSETLYRRQFELSEIPSINAGRGIHAKLRFRTFPWGEAVIFLASYLQGITSGPVNNDMLILVVQGFTRDGRYAVNGHFKILHSKLPNTLWDEPQSGKKYFAIMGANADVKKWLDSQPDDSFSPTFRQYEEFLGALRIEPSGGKIKAGN